MEHVQMSDRLATPGMSKMTSPLTSIRVNTTTPWPSRRCPAIDALWEIAMAWNETVSVPRAQSNEKTLVFGFLVGGGAALTGVAARRTATDATTRTARAIFMRQSPFVIRSRRSTIRRHSLSSHLIQRWTAAKS